MHFLRPSMLALVGGLGWIGAVSFASTSVVGCSGGSGESNGNGSDSGSESSSSQSGSSSSSSGSAPTFTQVYADILGPQCGAVCHLAGGPGVTIGMLDMSTQTNAFNNLVEVNAMGAPNGCAGKGVRVVPGHPDESILAEKVDPTLFSSLNCGVLMPQGGATLPESQIMEIENWITAGAPNN
jgi:hypothetical protein